MTTKYMIFVKSNEHFRTNNTPMMGRTYYTCYHVASRTDLAVKVQELRNSGAEITDIRTNLGYKVQV